MGVAEIVSSQNGEGLGFSDRKSGWKKASVAALGAEHILETESLERAEKRRAIPAVKRVAAHIGLKPADILLLDTFAAFSKDQDWDEGRAPIVWPSNDFLMRQTGFSLSSLKRHVRRLEQIGLIRVRSSANGKRWGRRAPDGHIIEAYGFDLTPISLRAAEFERLDEDVRREADLCKRLKREITITRRDIRAQIEMALSERLTGPWEHLIDIFERLVSALPSRKDGSERIAKALEALLILKEKITTAVRSTIPVDNRIDTCVKPDAKAEEVASMGAKNEPHLQTTIQHNQVSSNAEKERETESEGPISTGERLTVGLTLQACPEFGGWAKNMGGYIETWSDAHRLAAQLAPMIGVSERLWGQATQTLGMERSVAAFALLFEKHASNEVRSVSGYLRGMARKASVGELHLTRSLYGRLARSGETV